MDRMRRIVLILLGFLLSTFVNGQVLKVQAGISVSSLQARLEYRGDVLTGEYAPLVGHSFFVGLDYLNKKYYSLSSNIGVVRKGSTEEYQKVNEEGEWVDATRRQTLDYFSINTTADFKYPIGDRITPFVSVGPRIDILLDEEYSELMISEGYKKGDGLNSYNYGLLLGCGTNYNFSKFYIGLRGDYYLNAKNVVDSPERYNYASYEAKDKTFTVNMVFGLKL
jgi:hypothetical protein